MKQALILISWYGTPESDWLPWLKKQLEKKGYEVAIPDLPTVRTDLPDMEQMLSLLHVSEDTLVIGHSLGALLGLRLAERQKFLKLVLVSGWDFDDGLAPEHRLFWPNKINHKKITENVHEFVVIHSDNDPYTPTQVAKDMCQKLGGTFVLVPNGGHLSQKQGNKTELPEVLPFI
jgi:predicted alpha/beta hydrolase family esterase